MDHLSLSILVRLLLYWTCSGHVCLGCDPYTLQHRHMSSSLCYRYRISKHMHTTDWTIIISFYIAFWYGRKLCFRPFFKYFSKGHFGSLCIEWIIIIISQHFQAFCLCRSITYNEIFLFLCSFFRIEFVAVCFSDNLGISSSPWYLGNTSITIR